jgi:hypothetical protein
MRNSLISAMHCTSFYSFFFFLSFCGYINKRVGMLLLCGSQKVPALTSFLLFQLDMWLCDLSP